MAAVVIDYVLQFAFNSIVFFLMADTDEEVARGVIAGEIDPDTTSYGNVKIGDTEYAIIGGDFWLYMLIVITVGVLYWMVLPGLKGWTLGKLLLGLRVVREDGTCPAGIGKNVVRQLLWIVDDFPYLIPALTGFIVVMTGDRNRRVGDIVAGTLVVRASAVGQPAATAAQPAYAAPAQVASGGGPQAPASPAQPAAPAASAEPAATPAGWYADPHGQKRLRYWDGSDWTEHTAD